MQNRALIDILKYAPNDVREEQRKTAHQKALFVLYVQSSEVQQLSDGFGQNLQLAAHH